MDIIVSELSDFSLSMIHTTIIESLNYLDIDALIIPLTDPHQSEYVPEAYNLVKFVSGFTGSAGTIMFTKEGGKYFWSDSRYEQQSAMEIPEFTRFIYGGGRKDLRLSGWLAKNMIGKRILLNGYLFSHKKLVSIEKSLISDSKTSEMPPNLSITRSTSLKELKSVIPLLSSQYLIILDSCPVKMFLEAKGGNVPTFVASIPTIPPFKSPLSSKLTKDEAKSQDVKENSLRVSKLINQLLISMNKKTPFASRLKSLDSDGSETLLEKSEITISLFLSSLDSIAWLLGIRAHDIKCNSVSVAYCGISCKFQISRKKPAETSIPTCDFFVSQDFDDISVISISIPRCDIFFANKESSAKYPIFDEQGDIVLPPPKYNQIAQVLDETFKGTMAIYTDSYDQALNYPSSLFSGEIGDFVLVTSEKSLNCVFHQEWKKFEGESHPSHQSFTFLTLPLCPCDIAKSIKTELEITRAREMHVLDGIAIFKTWCWLCDCIEEGKALTEYDFSLKLSQMRKDHGASDDSFEAIVGSGKNGSIIHYKPSESESSVILPGQPLLVDSGGIYLPSVTTDTTRTWVVPSIHSKTPSLIQSPDGSYSRSYSSVLKAHIALSMAVFPEDTQSKVLDFIARHHVWGCQLGDFGHSTGHGVGCGLCVHEGPPYISSSDTPVTSLGIKENMMFSNEPGFYLPGKYGIRIENVHVAKKINPIDIPHPEIQKKELLQLETLTLVPYDVSCPPYISSSDTPVTSLGIKENMMFSNEPGFYLPGKYGIRIENVHVAKKINPIDIPHPEIQKKELLQLETLTLVPYDVSSPNINWERIDDICSELRADKDFGLVEAYPLTEEKLMLEVNGKLTNIHRNILRSTISEYSKPVRAMKPGLIAIGQWFPVLDAMSAAKRRIGDKKRYSSKELMGLWTVIKSISCLQACSLT
ncbi:hypothetical protein ADUPG1_006516 [Aduncisulcus paluster]|uniref:Peptidase M24 domain-containing protein n=1 Tax=Aduncisulcus paluster TaxID=2918883 RepID=A0ABQ5KII6_9EUKA|nr:hypothetical protein ADUPG1_006516 [Aduncisulcus paluster]